MVKNLHSIGCSVILMAAIVLKAYHHHQTKGHSKTHQTPQLRQSSNQTSTNEHPVLSVSICITQSCLLF